jgi:hypothetical protein
MHRMRINISPLRILVVTLLFLVGSAVQAQSGRRMKPGGATAPAPSTQTPQPEMPKTPAKLPAQPQLPLLVIGSASQTLYMSFPFPEKMQAWVAKRLRDGAGLMVTQGEGINRNAAIKRAKSETETFIIWVQLDEEPFDSPTTSDGRRNFEKFHINYYVLSPVTGKAKFSGVVYLGQSSPTVNVGGNAVPTCYPDIRDRGDYLLLQASIEVANRIMSKLNVPIPPICP